jgi:dTDP-glucose 4,6-dehydratase
MQVLLTGASGFLGRYLANELLDKNIDVRAMVRRPLLALIQQVYHDFRAPLPERVLNTIQPDYIIHCGAEVHGLRSLENPALFVQSNVMGTFNLLEAARYWKPKGFMYISSAEAVGSCAHGSLAEDALMRPSNPYAAAKGTGEMLVQSYFKSFGVPTCSIRTMNIFGEGQDTSKFFPAVIKKILADETVTCHVGPEGCPGSRHWLYVKVLANSLVQLLEHLRYEGENYHLVGPELSNFDVISCAEKGLNKTAKLTYLQPGPSHDMRYSIKSTNGVAINHTREMAESFLVQTARWYGEHQEALL